ncbi:MAG: iron-containing alcohol dehydrogenase [Ilumatobacteraceae bacterium]
MERSALDDLLVVPADHDVVVGVGGGTALDTAKYLAWRLERPLLQIPTITSVDAAFTDAVGVREQGRVRYVGHVVPDLVVLDVPLVRSAPPHLNRAGIGDILSCHTGLFDWRVATSGPTPTGRPEAPPWNDALAELGCTLLTELDGAAEEVAATSADAVRFLADAYRRIGAACAWAGHSRFEEGSEHFFAYAYEHLTGAHLVHGELVTLAVCALAHVQGNDPQGPRSIAVRARTRAHPGDLGIDQATFVRCLVGLTEYVRAEGLDICVVDARPVTADQAEAAWRFVDQLARAGDR